MSDDELLDRAIDQVARELTATDPRRGFVGRVAERLEAGPRSRSWAWQLAGAAAILAVIAFVVARPQKPAPAHLVARHAVPVQTVPLAEAAPRLAASNPGRVQELSERFQRPQVVRIAVDLDAPRIPALPEPSDLRVVVQEPETLTVAALELPGLTVMPLTPNDKEPR